MYPNERYIPELYFTWTPLHLVYILFSLAWVGRSIQNAPHLDLRNFQSIWKFITTFTRQTLGDGSLYRGLKNSTWPIFLFTWPIFYPNPSTLDVHFFVICSSCQVYSEYTKVGAVEFSEHMKVYNCIHQADFGSWESILWFRKMAGCNP